VNVDVDVDDDGVCSVDVDEVGNSFFAREMILRCIVLDNGYFDPNLCIF